MLVAMAMAGRKALTVPVAVYPVADVHGKIIAAHFDYFLGVLILYQEAAILG